VNDKHTSARVTSLGELVHNGCIKLNTLLSILEVYCFNIFCILTMLQILMNAKKSQPASVHNANAKIPLGVMSASAIAVCSTHEKMTRVLVSLLDFFSLFLCHS